MKLETNRRKENESAFLMSPFIESPEKVCLEMFYWISNSKPGKLSSAKLIIKVVGPFHEEISIWSSNKPTYTWTLASIQLGKGLFQVVIQGELNKTSLTHVRGL